MFLNEIGKEEINKLDIHQFEGKINIVDSNEEFATAMSEIGKYDVLGFDTETKPAFKKGEKHMIALVQISNTHQSWLFRINKIGFPQKLQELFEDENILKVGLGLTDDMSRLRALRSFKPAGFLDLQKYVEAFSIESKSLKKIVAIVLGYKISKSQQMSNWESPDLSEGQQRYAATDAWVCLEVYNKLRESISKLINDQG
jgi:ribonuclease D